MANRRGDGETQANRVRGACLPGGEPNKGGEEHQGSGWYANWHQIKEDLIDIREGLKEEEENNGGVFDSGGELIEKLSKVIARVPRVPRAKDAAEGIEARLDRIEALATATHSRVAPFLIALRCPTSSQFKSRSSIDIQDLPTALNRTSWPMRPALKPGYAL